MTMNESLSDWSKSHFKTQANCQLLPAEGELATTIIDMAHANLAKAGIGTDANTWDLFPLYSILVSTGINKNTDAFDNVELWRARHSPKNKPVNLRHDQSRIVGHILDNITVGEDLKPIPEDTKEEDLPYRLHIVTASVLYKFWEDAKAQEEMSKIIADINAGKNWFVSMECLFKNFDFLMTNASTGEQKLLPRTQETAHLAKHLRQYGGKGIYNNYAMARLLRDITFSAVGLVENPANPDSIINKSLNFFTNENSFSTLGYITLEQLNKETCMAETNVAAELKTFNIEETSAFKALKAHNERLQKDNDTIHAKAEDMKKELDAIHSKTLAAKDDEIEKLKKEKTEAEKGWDDEKEEKDEMAKCSASLKTELETVKAELDAEKATREAYEAASRTKSRVESLVKADKSLTVEKAAALVAQWSELSDTGFTAMVTTVAEYAKKAPKPVTAETVIETTVAVEASPALGTVVENEIEVTRAQVSAWFGSKNKKGS